MVIDPVCKMEMEPRDAAATSEYAGKTYYFCHINCKNKFDAQPQKYVKELQELRLKKAS